MKTVAQLCKPRDSIFVDTARDDVLNLSDLIEGRVNADKFFEENFITHGMQALMTTVFKRFKGESPTGVIKLTQAMGGGKTHNMIAVAELTQDAKWRKKIVGRYMGSAYENIGDVKVIAFSGRESDAPFGIWGSLAEQLGKKDLFKDLYSPLRAPGESAWINLLQGQKILILLDELPPYLENARSVAIGSSDLCRVTMTALSNLFSALGREQLSNVCLVFSDLQAAYESASGMLASSFKELEQEANRVAINITPVELNSDEMYDILKKRLFESYPDHEDAEVKAVADAYKTAVSAANKSGLTMYQPDKLYLGVRDSYPFHPSIKDLYARFKENVNFQQTRGLIRLMRQIIRQFYESGAADKATLVNVYDVDLNNGTMLSFIREIKPSLENAINHDIAQHGKSVAETIDAEYKEEFPHPYAQTISRLLLMSSLNDTAQGLQGLTDSEILGFVCQPGIDMNQYNKVLEEIKLNSWYLKQDNRGRYYFQNTKNMIAEMNTLVDSYSNEAARKDLCKFLSEGFTPKLKKCYELLYVMPAIDEIQLDSNKVALVIFEPYPGTGLHPDLQRFYDNQVYKNRVMFLSGQRAMMERLYENCKKWMAIRQIIASLKAEHVPEMDQQFREANDQLDKATQMLLSTIRETFVTLYFPTKNGINNEDFKLEFSGNKFNGEDQIVKTLADAQKFQDFSTEDRFLDTMRAKCESRIYTTREMPWNQILERAGTNPAWQWYHPSQMKEMYEAALKKDKWRVIGGYVTKGPFPKEPTSVTVEQMGYDYDKREFTLKVRGINGNVVYYDVGAEPTTASQQASSTFLTKNTELYFLCVDTTKEDPHPTGEVLHFYCKAPLKFEQRMSAHGSVMQLETNPDYEVRYTTDGSNPKENGGRYTGDIVLPDNCKFVQVAVYNHGQLIEEKTIPVKEKVKEFEIDDNKPLKYTAPRSIAFTDTASAYAEFAYLRKLEGVHITNAGVTLTDKLSPENYVELSTSRVKYTPADLQQQTDMIRGMGFRGREVIVSLLYKSIEFDKGATFKLWMEEHHYDLNDLKAGIKQ